jgi:endonuclease YncB( thermonuclease family)
VVDGDTLHAAVRGMGDMRVRLEGIDCPEPGQPFSQVARSFTRAFAFDRDVTLTVIDVDRFGRLVARLTSGGRDLSLALVKAGLAWHYTDYSSDRLLAAAEQDARANRRGMWVDGSPTPPWVKRRAPSRDRTSAAPAAPMPHGPFRANVRSGVYHADRCRNARCKNCTRVFTSEAEARAAGFRPAGDCLR